MAQLTLHLTPDEVIEAIEDWVVVNHNAQVRNKKITPYFDGNKQPEVKVEVMIEDWG